MTDLEQLEPPKDESAGSPRTLEDLEPYEQQLAREQAVHSGSKDRANQIRARLGRPPLPDESTDVTPKERVAARGEQQSRERKQRLGRIAPEQQASRPVAGPLVDYEGPNMSGGGDNQIMGQLLAELQKQTERLDKIANTIASLGTYRA